MKSCTTPRTNNLTPKTTKSSKTDGNKSKDDQIRNTLATVRLSSAGSSAKRFFQSESPASKMTGGDSFTPRDPFATEIPSSKDYVSDYLFSNFMPQSAGKMDFTTDDFVSPYADGPEPEVSLFIITLLYDLISCTCSCESSLGNYIVFKLSVLERKHYRLMSLLARRALSFKVRLEGKVTENFSDLCPFKI